MISKNYQVKKKQRHQKVLGKTGEHLARKFLLKHSYILLDNNYSIPGGEIDIIAEQDGIIVFVEVKARTNNAFGEAELAVTPFKKFKLTKAIYSYLAKKHFFARKWRLDAICITLCLDTQKAFLKHFQNILVQ